MSVYLVVTCLHEVNLIGGLYLLLGAAFAITLMKKISVVTTQIRPSKRIYTVGLVYLHTGFWALIFLPLLGILIPTYFVPLSDSSMDGLPQMITPTSENLFSILLLFLPTGLALISQSRLWRAIAIFMNSYMVIPWVILFISLLIPGKGQMPYYGGFTGIWMTLLIIVASAGLVLLTHKAVLPVFGLASKSIKIIQ